MPQDARNSTAPASPRPHHPSARKEAIARDADRMIDAAQELEQAAGRLRGSARQLRQGQTLRGTSAHISMGGAWTDLSAVAFHIEGHLRRARVALEDETTGGTGKEAPGAGMGAGRIMGEGGGGRS